MHDTATKTTTNKMSGFTPPIAGLARRHSRQRRTGIVPNLSSSEGDISTNAAPLSDSTASAPAGTSATPNGDLPNGGDQPPPKPRQRGSTGIVKRVARDAKLSQSMQVRLTETIGDITGSSRNLGDGNDDSKTGLDGQLSKIESILEGPAAENLTEDQKEAIESLRDTLLIGTLHLVGGYREVVPTALLEQSDTDKTSTKAYLAAEYGGVHVQRKSRLGIGNPVKALRSGSFFKAIGQRPDGTSNAGDAGSAEEEGGKCGCALDYAPPEWTSLPEDAKSILRDKLSWRSLGEWDFDIFQVSRLCDDDKAPLVIIGWAILGSPYAQRAMGDDNVGPNEGYDFITQFKFLPEQLCSFLRDVESHYQRSNPYHNNIHAADVVQSTHSLLRLGGKKFATDSLEIFALLLASAVHDMGHPGRNNTYQVNARTEDAINYNDKSVLENMHSSRAFHMLLGSGRRKEIDVLGGLEDEQITSVRNLMVQAILGTDMSKHFSHINHIKSIKSHVHDHVAEKGSDVLRFLLHLADISNPAKKNPTFIEWADRALEEFFAQGDLEKKDGLPVSPLCDREKEDKDESQIGFIAFVVKPAFELLGEILPRVNSKVMPVIESNLDFWKRQKEMKDRMKNLREGTAGSGGGRPARDLSSSLTKQTASLSLVNEEEEEEEEE